MITLPRDRKVIRVKHARQFILDKKNHLTGGGGQSAYYILLLLDVFPATYDKCCKAEVSGASRNISPPPGNASIINAVPGPSPGGFLASNRNP